MRIAIAFTPFAPWLLLLASCSSPPKPPTVDESHRRPVNNALTVELQVCRHELQNTRLMASESGRQTQATAATLAHLAARQQVLTGTQANAGPPAQANSIYMVRFGFGSARVVIPAHIIPALVQEARTSPLILLRGRTDGGGDAPAESRIARDRATAVRDHLVAHGVEPARIRVSYQPVGDHVADNSGADGRSLNRRVEIEFYRTLPVALVTTSVAAP